MHAIPKAGERWVACAHWLNRGRPCVVQVIDENNYVAGYFAARKGGFDLQFERSELVARVPSDDDFEELPQSIEHWNEP